MTILGTHNVRIRIPDRGTTNDSAPAVGGIGAADLIQITGRVGHFSIYNLYIFKNIFFNPFKQV